MGKEEVEAFLTHLAANRQVAVSTHQQALSALLFLYGKVLEVQLPWIAEIGRPAPKQRLLARGDDPQRGGAGAGLSLEGVHQLLARLLYGTGLRITEKRCNCASRIWTSSNRPSSCARARLAKTRRGAAAAAGGRPGQLMSRPA